MTLARSFEGDALTYDGLRIDGLVPFPDRPTLRLATPAAPPSISVVIPTLNEAQNLPHVLAAIPEWVDEIVIVDGGSTDGTTDIARQHRPDAAVLEQTGRGKGQALAQGFAATTADIIVMLDADGSTDPSEIPRYVAALRTGADFAKGTRFVAGGGSVDITCLRRIGNRALAGLVNSLWKTRYSDLCYGYNAFWRSCLPALSVDCNGFEVETLLNIRAASAGLRVVEVPSFEHNRLSGVSNLNAGRDGVRILRTIVAEWIRPT